MNLSDVYDMPLHKDTEYTKFTPHDSCVRATILHISKAVPRGKWWKQCITVVDETLRQEHIHFRTEYQECILKRGQDEGKEAIFRLKAYIGEYASFLSGYVKEILGDKE